MSLVVLILAAGEGTRMKSAKPKVLHEALGRPLLGYVLNAVANLKAKHTSVLLGAGKDQVEEWLSTAAPSAVILEQVERRGTGHAVRVALHQLQEKGIDLSGDLLVLTGDTPLLTSSTLQSLLACHADTNAQATVLTAVLADPTGYGRILRDVSGAVEAIVEHRDASDAQREITEINSGMYVFKVGALQAALDQLTTNNSQGEEYLTDVLQILNSLGHKVAGLQAADSQDINGVNDRAQLAAATAVLKDRINHTWLLNGVTIIDPASTWIEADVVLAPDCTIYPGCHLRGNSAVASGAQIGPDTTLIDTVVEQDAKVLRSHTEGAHIGVKANVGPFSFLRPGADLQDGAKAGAYVEIKNSIIGKGSKVPHLSYVGDATIGERTNIGAATIFVNYDGENKHRTTVGDAVRIGSDTMLVAPVEIGDGAYTAAGSVITENVPAGALGLGRARQTNLLGWVFTKRPRTESAEAAAAADEKPETEKP